MWECLRTPRRSWNTLLGRETPRTPCLAFWMDTSDRRRQVKHGATGFSGHFRPQRWWGRRSQHGNKKNQDDDGQQRRTNGLTVTEQIIELSSSHFQPASLTSSIHRAEPAVSAKSPLEQSVTHQLASCFTTAVSVSREKTKIHTERSDKPTEQRAQRPLRLEGGEEALCKLCWAVWGGQDEWWTACKLWTDPPTTITSSPRRGPECWRGTARSTTAGAELQLIWTHHSMM